MLKLLIEIAPFTEKKASQLVLADCHYNQGVLYNNLSNEEAINSQCKYNLEQAF
jgi:hypothetical protein